MSTPFVVLVPKYPDVPTITADRRRFSPLARVTTPSRSGSVAGGGPGASVVGGVLVGSGAGPPDAAIAAEGRVSTVTPMTPAAAAPCSMRRRDSAAAGMSAPRAGPDEVASRPWASSIALMSPMVALAHDRRITWLALASRINRSPPAAAGTRPWRKSGWIVSASVSGVLVTPLLSMNPRTRQLLPD